MTDRSFYFEQLYPLQDRILRCLQNIDTGFYLTGDTAASRGYLNHRFSDDLDFFVNDQAEFGLWVERVIQALNQETIWRCEVLLKEERYTRLFIHQDELSMKIELVNDVPARVGGILEHPVLGRLDSADNILANKVTAVIDREAPKDFADIWGFCCRMGLSLSEAITNADSKAAGIFPADLGRLLCTVTDSDWTLVRWNVPPVKEEYLSQLYQLGEQLLLNR